MRNLPLDRAAAQQLLATLHAQGWVGYVRPATRTLAYEVVVTHVAQHNG